MNISDVSRKSVRGCAFWELDGDIELSVSNVFFPGSTALFRKGTLLKEWNDNDLRTVAKAQAYAKRLLKKERA